MRALERFALPETWDIVAARREGPVNMTTLECTRRAITKTLGGSGSGNFGHEGRPGEVGGSGEGSGYTIEYHGTTPENAKAILTSGKFRVGSGQAGVSTTQGYREALDYANGNPEGVIAVRVKKDARMVGKEGKDFLTGTGSFNPEDLTPVEIAKGK